MKIKLGLGKTNMERIADWCGGELYDFTGESGNSFEYVCTDSREADADTMFVATRGERVDGHDYILKAIEQGCRCILCEYVPTNISGKAAAYVVVENSMDAFAHCAKGYRSEDPLLSVAITGSVGKTTTKELTAAILRQKFKTYCTAGNFNSVIGMPMSLMEADGSTERAVFEMGMSSFGEIRSMSRTATPYVAMVTNIGTSHLEYLKTRENIAKAKLEIGEGVVDSGYLLLNGDEPLLDDHYCDRYETVYVGYDEKCAFQIWNVRVDERGTCFDLYIPQKEIYDLRISLIGEHFAYNAAFAAAAAYLLGADERNIRDGLSSYVAQGMRMNVTDKNGVTLIADCYNAAPESMKGAIDTLAQIKVDGKRVAVLGDMKELGALSDELHASVGKYLAEKRVDRLFTVGKSGELIAKAALDAGMREENVTAFDEELGAAAIAEKIKEKIAAGDAILFKASRAMKFEEIIEAVFHD